MAASVAACVSLWVPPAHAMAGALIDRFAFVGAHLDLAQNPRPAGAEQIWIDRPGARLEGWLLRPASAVGPTPAVLYFHGNAELIDTNMPRARGFLDRGYAVLLAEYRGYGRSTGRPSAQSLPGDALAFFDRLTETPGIDPARIVVAGRSLGVSAAAAVLGARPACAAILESGFLSLGQMVSQAGFPSGWAGGRLDNRAAVARFAGPVLVMHGQTDEVIPFSHGAALATAAQTRAHPSAASRFSVFPGGHNPMAPLAEIQVQALAFLEQDTSCAPLRGPVPRS